MYVGKIEKVLVRDDEYLGLAMNSVNGPFFDPFFLFTFCRKSKTALAVHFVVSLPEKRRVAHRETTFLFVIQNIES